MRRAFRLALIGVLVTAVLATTAVLTLRDRVLTKAARALEHSLAERLGGAVEIGRVHLDLMPVALIAEDVTIRSPSSALRIPPLTVGRITAKPSLISILTTTPVIRSLLIERPRLHLVTGPHGASNIPQLGDGRPRDPKSPPSVLVRKIDIVDAEVIYRSSERAVTFFHTALAVVPDSVMATVAIELASPAGALSIGDRSMPFGATRLHMSVNRDGLTIEEGVIEGAGLGATVEGSLAFGAPGDLDLHATVSADLAALSTAFFAPHTLTGHLAIDARIEGPLADPHSHGTVAGHGVGYDGVPIGNLSGRVSLADGRLAATELSGDVFEGTIRGTGDVVFAPTPLWSIAVDVQHTRPLPFLRRLMPSTAIMPSFEASGPVTLSGRGRSPAALEGEGRLALVRHPTAPTSATPPLRVRALLELVESADLPWRVHAGVLTLRDAFAKTGSGRLDVAGTLDPAGEVDLTWRLAGQDAGELVAALRIPFTIGGAASFDGRLDGRLRAPRVEGRAAIQGLVLKGHPAGDVATTLLYVDRRLGFRDTSWREGDSTYDVEGGVAWPPGGVMFDLTARLHRAYVEDVLPIAFRALPIAGQADGTFTFRGSLAEFLISGNLTLTDGIIYGQAFDDGRVAMTFDRQRVIFSRAELRRGESELRGSGSIAYGEGFQARLESSRLHLQTISLFGLDRLPLSGAASLDLTMGGTFDRPEMHGTLAIQYLEGAGQPLGAGRVQVDVADRRVRLQAVLDDQRARLDGTLHWAPTFPMSAVLDVNESSIVPLIRPWLPAALSDLSAAITGRIALEGPLTKPRAWRADATLQRLSADVGEYLVENHGDLVLTLDHGQLEIGAFQLRGTDTTLTVSGGVDLFREYRLIIVGEADLRLTRLFVPTISSGRGKTYLVLKISDRWESPKIQGGVTVQDARLKSRALPQTIGIETLGLFFNERQILLESLEGTVGNGRVSATGQIHLQGFRPERFGYLIDITGVQVPLTERLDPTVSGQLVFQGTPDKQTLRGELTIDRAVYDARIDVQDWVLDLRRRAEARDAAGDGPALGRHLALNIHVSGRRHIGIKNNLADIPLEVDLFVKGTADRPYLIGRIEAREGTMTFRSNTFNVQSATVDFIDPTRIRPVLDLRATTKVQTYFITMQLTGTIERFDLDLTSDPSLSETDILALLTVGRTAEQVAKSQTNLSRDEAASIALQALLEEGVQRLPGVDRLVDSFQIDPHYDPTVDQSAPRISVGKQLLDDRLIVHYTTTLDTSSRQGVRVEYELARNVFLIGEQDYRGFGGDVRFRFEFR